MNNQEEQELKNLLTAEMVSRITLAESINIIHNIALDQVNLNLEEMSDEEKQSAREELMKKAEEQLELAKTKAQETEKTKEQAG
jgi:hypothetical protein